MIFLVSHAVRIFCVGLMLCAASTIAPQDGPTRNLGNISLEDGLRWALVHGTLDDVDALLDKNPDPFCMQEHLTPPLSTPVILNEKSGKRTDQKIQRLRNYSDEYLIKLIQGTPHTPTKAHAEILAHTPLPTALATIITDYMNSFTYQLKPLVMHYIRNNIVMAFAECKKPFFSLLSRCTDEQGGNHFDYVPIGVYGHLLDNSIDPFIARSAQQIFEQCRDHSIIFYMIKVHIHNLTQDPVLFASPLEIKLFAKKLRGCVNEMENWDFNKDYFERSDSYKLIKDYVTAVPSLLTMHYENKSIFDHIDAACHANLIHFCKVNSVLSLILDNKVNPNMQDEQTGNTFLHRVALDTIHFTPIVDFTSDDCPDESPFIQQCAPQLDLSIANNEGQTVFDIVKSQIKDCDEKKIMGTRDSYQQFMQKLLAIQASQQVPKQLLASKSSEQDIVTLS